MHTVGWPGEANKLKVRLRRVRCDRGWRWCGRHVAAATAARAGARTLLLEKNLELGKKLAITGGGRCNVINNKLDVRTMLSQYPEAGKFLFSAFTQFGVVEMKG